MSILPLHAQVDLVKFHKDLKNAMDSLSRRQVGYLDENPKLKEELIGAVDDVFKLDPFNHMAFSRLEHYMTKFEIDSFCNNLKERFPSSVQPYILNAYYSKDNPESQVEEISKGLLISDSSFELNLNCAYLYYTLYLKDSKKYAKVCLKYSKKSMALNSSLGGDLKYFVAQISEYLGLNHSNILKRYLYWPEVSDTRPLNYQRYFRTEDLIGLKDNWINDSIYNIAHPLRMANFRNQWYSEQLFAMKEPILFNYKKKEVYRFTWLRTFHNPIAIRAYSNNGKHFISWKKNDGAGGYAPGKLTTDKTKILTKIQWAKLEQLLEKANFWSLKKEEKMGFDGAQWLFEGNKFGKYHFVERWSAKSSEIGKVGLFLLNLTDLNLNSKNIY